MLRIALVHKHYDKQHLEEVMEEMKTLGAPKINAVWMEGYDHWQALEGCHRIRAAKELGLVPEIIEIEYSDEMCSTIDGYDIGEGDDYSISYICDEGYKSHTIEFSEVE